MSSAGGEAGIKTGSVGDSECESSDVSGSGEYVIESSSEGNSG